MKTAFLLMVSSENADIVSFFLRWNARPNEMCLHICLLVKMRKICALFSGVPRNSAHRNELFYSILAWKCMMVEEYMKLPFLSLYFDSFEWVSNLYISYCHSLSTWLFQTTQQKPQTNVTHIHATLIFHTIYLETHSASKRDLIVGRDSIEFQNKL